MKTTLLMLIVRLEEILKAYERTTPEIDQQIVDRVLKTIQRGQKAAALLSVIVLMTVGCRRKDEAGNPVVSPMPGGGSTTMMTYAGAVTPTPGCVDRCYQMITTNADVVHFPSDSVEVYLCKNATCAVNALPALKCSQTNDPAAACYTPEPSVDIVLGIDVVRLVDASNDGYGTYAIETTVTR